MNCQWDWLEYRSVQGERNSKLIVLSDAYDRHDEYLPFDNMWFVSYIDLSKGLFKWKETDLKIELFVQMLMADKMYILTKYNWFEQGLLSMLDVMKWYIFYHMWFQ